MTTPANGSPDQAVEPGTECVFQMPEALAEKQMHYCPGCGHGIYHRLIAEMVDEFGLLDKTVGVCPVGCSVFAYKYFEFDMIEAAHGRAPAVAVGVKRTNPHLFVFTYQGDGDLASIGTAEIIQAAARGDPLTVFFVNNGIFGMTGGQMAPTSLPGQKTTTSPSGRDVERTGQPIKVCELLSSLDGLAYAARVPLSSPKGVNTCRKYMRNAIRAQLEGHGLGIVEALTGCPVQWALPPVKAMEYIDSTVVKSYPPGEIVNRLPDARKKKSA
jgi:2-oxoglutarate ferredoxin oxidoreductase subunit beta